ncbi:MAG: helix-hairpin-helix domain-containing protein [Verrucomicrobiota bacterium]|nr:helix-hairpin-helix domain-containing protein [Verrucomicrobiota bacterium]
MTPGGWHFLRLVSLALGFCFVSAKVEARGPWLVLNNCREIPNPSNDADSFHTRADGRHYIFRLYFVDAAETTAGFRERVEEQAKYFGLTVPQTLQLGALAKKFVDEKLAQPFTVRTCKQDALGRSKIERFYAFVGTNEGDLAELLVANGLARVHGTAATPVGLNSPEREREKLRRLENEARQKRVGGWGAPLGRMTTRLPKQPSKTGLDSFDAFFHPEKIAAAEAAEALQQAAPLTSNSTPATAPARGALDPNSATKEELENIKGIGPVLAQRIIEARPFKTADDLRHVKGIGPKKYEQMRPSFAGADHAGVIAR